MASALSQSPSTVLILGGTGRIGAAVALDLLQNTTHRLVLTGRHARIPASLAAWTSRLQPLALDLSDDRSLKQASARADLVIHCAGPFRERDLRVLQTCIDSATPYLDVSDSPDYVRSALQLHAEAEAASVTAILSTGVFPGLSNSMARLAVEQFEQVEKIQLNYVVAGSGGAGKTVMRTTFLEIQHPFPVWVEGEWRSQQPYRDPELISFPPPYGSLPVYWFNTSEAATLVDSFKHLGVQTVITKFGSLPRFYNPLTALMTRGPFGQLLKSSLVVEFLAQVSYTMTQVSDRFSGVGLAMQTEVSGQPRELRAQTQFQVEFCAKNTAIAAGMGTSFVAQAILNGQLRRPGVWPVEQAVPTELFLAALQARELTLSQRWIETNPS